MKETPLDDLSRSSSVTQPHARTRAAARRCIRRSRLWVIALALLAALVCAPASIAYAQETTEAEVSHEAELCIEKLEGGGDVEDCQEAPNKFLPVRDEIIWAVVSFAVLVVLLAKVAVPLMKKGLAARTERIRSEINSAENAKTDADRLLADYRAQLADARNEANRIIEEARRSADSVRVDLEARAHADVAEMRARAAADIDAARVSAIADLRTEVAALAIGAAEAIVQKNLDHETQVHLVENFIRQVENRN